MSGEKLTSDEIFDIFGGFINSECLALIQNWDSMSVERRAEYGATEEGPDGFRQALRFVAKKHPAKDPVDQSVDYLGEWVEMTEAFTRWGLHMEGGQLRDLHTKILAVVQRYRQMRELLRANDIKLPDASH